MQVGAIDLAPFGGSQLGARDGCRQAQGRVCEGRAGSLVPRGARSTISLTAAGASARFWSKPNWQCLLTQLCYQQGRLTGSPESLQKRKSNHMYSQQEKKKKKKRAGKASPWELEKPGVGRLSPACLGGLPQNWEPAPDPATAGDAGHRTVTSHLHAHSP